MDFLAAALPFLSSFNANQTSRQNAREARDWQEDMYLKYNSPSALVRQYNEAGINPALMFGGQTPAAPTDTSAAETTPASTGSVTEMLGELMRLDLLDSEKRLNAANAAKAEADAAKSQSEKTGQDIENEFKPKILEQSLERGSLDIKQAENAISRFQDELDNLRASTQEYKTRSQYNAASAMLAVANRAFVGLQGENMSLQNARLAFENEFQQEFGIRPDEPVWNAITGLFGKTSRMLVDGSDALGNPLLHFGSQALDWFKRNSVFGYGVYYGKKE